MSVDLKQKFLVGDYILQYDGRSKKGARALSYHRIIITHKRTKRRYTYTSQIPEPLEAPLPDIVLNAFWSFLREVSYADREIPMSDIYDELRASPRSVRDRDRVIEWHQNTFKQLGHAYRLGLTYTSGRSLWLKVSTLIKRISAKLETLQPHTPTKPMRRKSRNGAL